MKRYALDPRGTELVLMDMLELRDVFTFASADSNEAWRTLERLNDPDLARSYAAAVDKLDGPKDVHVRTR